MANMLGKMFKEYIFGISIVVLVIGVVVLLFGVLGMWLPEFLMDMFSLNEDILAWSLYILILGVVLTLFGVYYLYEFIKNKRFLLDELRTNKRSEFMKTHAELKKAARHLPSKYQKMLAEKEKELRVK
ncbi:MAG: DUF3198 domain-containing protein [Candidatus Thermoplasmatota archaeon]|nr:DUF3198 domain-containing protein [Candidatus Thermoplasmatota archaeon]MBS3802041.1 DUF3198 domain-containing protein [Candidatus Thermoplasmatota archaeon]